MRELPVRVLFVSRRNSLRSLLAQACLNHLGGGRFLAYSCGSVVAPNSRPHPLVVTALTAVGMSHDNLSCKSWRRYAGGGDDRPMRFVITLADDPVTCAGLPWPGQPDSALWSFPDLLEATRQAPVTAQDVQQMLFSMRRRIELLVSLPLRDAHPADVRSDLRDLAYAG